MLVLSRRPKDKICFPALDISVEVVRVNGDTVRLGIEAPKDIKVLRHELVGQIQNEVAAEQCGAAKLSHDMRNRLNTATLALHLMQQQLQTGRHEDAQRTLERAIDAFRTFSSTLGTSPPRSDRQSGMQRRMLVVEDERNERELLSGILRMNGFAVDTAEDGLEAMAYLDEQELPDGVLMDMRMPRLDGPAAVSAIRQQPNYSGLKVFAVSATDPDDLGVSTGPRGIDRWFAKPLNPNSLIDELKREFSPQLN